MATSSLELCKCGKEDGWVTMNEVTKPCPRCGRRYLGVYDRSSLGIRAVDIKDILPAIDRAWKAKEAFLWGTVSGALGMLLLGCLL